MDNTHDQRAHTDKPAAVSLRVNDRDINLHVAPQTPLLYVLRNDLELNGPKFGCGLGECGACSILIDGTLARSCSTPVGRASGCDIKTLEGLGSADALDYVQAAFVAEQAAQCGYCLNGMIMATHALLRHNPAPGETEIRQALRHNLCRCGTHIEILAAVRRAIATRPADATTETTPSSRDQNPC